MPPHQMADTVSGTAIMFYLQLLFILIAATALACWCGWGAARLALPASLQPYRRELTPLIGYALLIVAGYWGVRTLVGLGVALPIALALAALLNLLGWRRTGLPPGMPLRELLPLLLLLLL